MVGCKVIALCLLVACVRAASDTPHCDKEAEAFGQCIKSEYDKNKDDYNNKLDKVWERINKCFQDNKCEPPASYDAQLASDLREEWDKLSKDAKTCIATANAKKTLEVVNACLKEQKVDQIKEPNFEDSELDEFSNQSLPHRRFFKGIEKTIIALKQCRADKGGKAVNATVTCVATVEKDVKEEICKRVEKCRKDKESDTCHQQGQKIHQALCSCGKNKIKEYIKAVEGLEAKNKDVSGDELIQAVCNKCKEDQQDIANNVQKCFKEKKVSFKDDDFKADGLFSVIGLFLSTAIHDPTGPMHAVIAAFQNDNPKYSKSELAEVRQILNDILQNFDCGCV